MTSNKWREQRQQPTTQHAVTTVSHSIHQATSNDWQTPRQRNSDHPRHQLAVNGQLVHAYVCVSVWVGALCVCVCLDVYVCLYMHVCTIQCKTIQCTPLIHTYPLIVSPIASVSEFGFGFVWIIDPLRVQVMCVGKYVLCTYACAC